ncbi:MAG: proline racemase family protein, partial [Proteobacteria bacterium]|nr:proline racemase family protein [Pseudomonadota bacterium]
MDYTRVTRALSNQFPSRLRTIDSHTAGETTRLIIGGIERIPGDTMKDKLYYFKAN